MSTVFFIYRMQLSKVYKFEGFRINESRYNMSKVKIAFFDIDGTILGFGKPDITEKTR